MSKEKELVYFAIDVEKDGRFKFSSVLAIGIYAGFAKRPLDKSHIIKRHWCLHRIPGETAEARCMTEFWSQFPEVYKYLTDPMYQVPIRKALDEIYAIFKELHEKYDVILLSDCPDFDLTAIPELEAKFGHLGETPRYLGTDERHWNNDPSERLAGIDGYDEYMEWVAKVAPHIKHTHIPDDDAEECFYQMRYANIRLDEIRKAKGKPALFDV